MGRRPVFAEVDMIDAARELIASEGPAAMTMQRLARRLRAPIGSLYHRFPSRSALLAKTWLETIAFFQGQFLRLLRSADTQVGEIARQYVTLCEMHPDHAQLLHLYRNSDFLDDAAPPELNEWARDLEKRKQEGLRRFARERLWSLSPSAIRRAAFAVLDIPYAAVRPHLVRGERLPPFLGELVARAAAAVFPSAVV